MALFKSRKAYYLYNPNTLTYERVYPSTRERLYAFLQHLTLGILFGVGAFFAFMHFFSSPMESYLQKENKLLQTQYEVLSWRLEDALKVLGDIQQRDENLYRAVFLAESIPESVRKSGFGGTNRYEYLSSLSNSAFVIETTKKMDMLRKQLYIQSNSLDELIAMGKDLERRSRCVPAIQPVSNQKLKHNASGYGMRIDPIYHTPRFHAGMDFSVSPGTDIYVTGDGKVLFAGWRQEYGNCVEIDHGFDYKTLYAHLEKTLVHVGQQVVRGEVIGLSGNTGKSTGPHLHYEVHFRGKPDNPIKYYYKDLTPEEYDRMIQLAENNGQVMD
ncbi:MAG: M23 family metallopeptidase [Tannerella sp.]|jgi:murein DD-endopeptidase MepM/ murein hydrolase activator NlpD|nr:M23 family metallopeptidase [Tannerella sp.]